MGSPFSHLPLTSDTVDGMIRAMEYAVHGMPQVMGFFDLKGEPVGWRFLGNVDAATGEKFYPPMPLDAIDVWGNRMWCGWTAYELRELWKFWHVN